MLTSMKKRALLSTIAAVAAAFALPAVADAKLCVRISAPATATPGESLRVSVTTLMPTWASGRLVGLRPVAAAVGVRLVLKGPQGEHREVVLRRVSSHPSVLRTTIRLSSVGTWRLSVRGWEFAPRACAPPAFVRVGLAK
jgi:hypothetical protein